MIEASLPKIVTESLPGPKSVKILEKRKQYVSKGVSNGTEIFIDEAKGALMKDVDGNIFLDFAAAIGVQNVGHCDDGVVEAIKEQAGKYIHTCYNVAMYESYAELCEKLTGLLAGNFPKKGMLANSGAEAVENAVKIARKYTKKTGIISLEQAFHGRTYMAMTLTSKVKPYKNGFGPFCNDTYKIPSAYCYRCPMGSTYPECGLACAEKLRTYLKGEMSSDYIAALIAEPVQGEGGFIVPPRDYLKALQDICRENGILFIVDEIQSGFARTGTMLALEQFGVEPDMVTMSKSLAAGVPISAVVGKAEIMDSVSSGEIGGTYGGSPLGCVAALKVIEKIKKDDLCKKSNELGNVLTSRANQMAAKYDVIGEVRGLGSMIGLEFVKDRKTKEPNADIVKKIMNYSYNKGVIFLSAGIFSNVLRFLPPLVMTEEQAQFAMNVLDEAIRNRI